MKKWLSILLVAPLLAGSAFAADLSGAKKELPASVRIGAVDFKSCVENSKLGKQEQASFEAMKNQMETVVVEKEKTLEELAGKLGNPDELDLMSPEAEVELKRKFRALSQEMGQIQNQFYQTLQQANYKVVQKISDAVAKASEKVAKDLKIDLVLNDETCFYCNLAIDISSLVVKEMDAQLDQENKNAPAALGS
jgi:outer membrane protein